MGWSQAKRGLLLYSVLFGLALAVCGWQIEEHLRLRRDAAEALVHRGRDITSTLGILLRSQRRAGVVSKERLQTALQDLIRPDELESVAILGATGDPIASAGHRIELTPDMLKARGVYWRDRTLTIMNLMDLGASGEDSRTHPPIVVTDERTARTLRLPPGRRPPEPGAAPEAVSRPDAANPAATTTPAASSPAVAAPPSSTPPANSPPSSDGGAVPGPSQTSNVPEGRFPFGRPPWMSRDEYENVIQKQGVHSIVLSLSTEEMHRRVRADLLLRSLVSLFGMGAAIISSLAWRNTRRNADLQIRLIKAGEMNTHLKEMNLAAAGLAHETRNPLNLIRGMAQMIAMEAGSSPKLVQHAKAIVEETDRVTVQLNEFINYSKPREAQLAPVDAARLVGDVARTLMPDLEEKRIQFTAPESPLLVEADEQLLRQAVFNVLLNATQVVAPGGRIEVRLTAVNPREAVLDIADDGPGVAAADRASIFKPYVTMRPGGAGLGLAIVAQIAAAHHWEVVCLGNEPRGALFRFNHLKIAAPRT